MEQAKQYRAELMKGRTEKKNWLDYVEELKNLNVVHNDSTIPEEYRGYPGVVANTIAGSLSFDDGMVQALRHVNHRTIPYIVNINDLYHDDEREERIENSKKLYELFVGGEK